MLKRNGENCEHPVPNYPGLLTASEYKAYQAAIPVVAEQIRLYDERTKILTEIENQTPQIAEKLSHQKDIPREDAWQHRHTLFKSGRGEMQLCSRHIGDKEIFGVIERFDPNSAYARAQGESDEIMRGNNAYLVLQNFVESERNVLQLFRKDIKATVEEKLSEQFPKLDASRVVKAIGARCSEQAKNQGEKETQARSVKIRM
jgi:hypothetical protein